MLTTERQARFSCPDHTEIELLYPLDAGENNQDNGKQQHVFYSPERYFSKQFAHGVATYPQPEPFTDGRFKR